MIPTPTILLPTDEAERLRTLHYYDILGSLQEDVFDELAVFAARVFNLPIAYISLIGEDEATYKAAHGFPLLPPQPRVSMLCSMAVKENQLVVYHDLASATPTAADKVALERALHHQARFYAGAPLRLSDEHSIGALCLVGLQPREFSASEQQVLERIAGLVSLTIAVRHVCLNHPIFGPDRWQTVRAQVRDEVYALGALMRYLTTRYGIHVPVSEDILQPVVRRLNDLRNILENYQYS